MRIYSAARATYQIAEAAALLGVSDDTVRRWIDSGRLPAHRAERGPAVVDGADLARVATQLREPPDPGRRASSARNRLTGIVTRVVRDTVMAQVEIQAGPFRLVSLMSREAADELGPRGRRPRRRHGEGHPGQRGRPVSRRVCASDPGRGVRTRPDRDGGATSRGRCRPLPRLAGCGAGVVADDGSAPRTAS